MSSLITLKKPELRKTRRLNILNVKMNIEPHKTIFSTLDPESSSLSPKYYHLITESQRFHKDKKLESRIPLPLLQGQYKKMSPRKISPISLELSKIIRDPIHTNFRKKRILSTDSGSLTKRSRTNSKIISRENPQAQTSTIDSLLQTNKIRLFSKSPRSLISVTEAYYREKFSKTPRKFIYNSRNASESLLKKIKPSLK
ncbi:hypothetical protein SteCoe_18674 [Stentor coeruleus]|uniref:Uncharacterized protein n=1 Tax=Stentor coeruleus TaxID=5963 RepID=A0A1R2BW55_9CILI|nr:hypothetical protein SteCoe_18674 [Stentor coeruleus]